MSVIEGNLFLINFNKKNLFFIRLIQKKLGF